MDNAESKRHFDSESDFSSLLWLIQTSSQTINDVVEDELTRLRIKQLNAVQALLLFRLGEKASSAKKLKSSGVYLGTNVTYNLNKLESVGYVTRVVSHDDRRMVSITVTTAGRQIQKIIEELFKKLSSSTDESQLGATSEVLQRLHTLLKANIRHIY